MRKYIAFAFVAALGLGGCATNPSTGLPAIDQTTLNNVEAQIQTAANEACGFVPAIGTVASVIGTFVGGGAVINLVDQVAGSICKAVVATPTVATASGRRRLASAPVVNGVVVQGYFTR